jgi:E3 Ubiquitin ligase
MLSTDIAALFCSDCIHSMPGWDYAIWLVIALLVTLFSLKRCHRQFKRARLIEDMPTSRIRSASQGYTELVGVAELQGNPQLAPLSSTLCLWWRYTIEKYQSSGKSSHWVTVEKHACSQFFHLRDTTGICQIDPEGAEISCHHRRTWHGSTRRPIGALKTTKPIRNGSFLSLATMPIAIGGMTFGRRYRYTEHLIIEGDPLYALGHFESDATGKRTLSPRQLTSDILSEWKQNFSQLLDRFDQNDNDELDLEEWKMVRNAALVEAKKRQTNQLHEPTEHLLSKPLHNGLPFIIGSTEQEQLSKRFRRQSIYYAIGFLLAGSMSCWLINSRFF